MFIKYYLQLSEISHMKNAVTISYTKKEKPFVKTEGFIPHFNDFLRTLGKNQDMMPPGTYYLKVVYRLPNVTDLHPKSLVGFLKNTRSERIGLYLLPQTKEIGYVWVPPHTFNLPVKMIPRSAMERGRHESKIGHAIRVSNPFGGLATLEKEEKARLRKEAAFKANFPPLESEEAYTRFNPNWGKKSLMLRLSKKESATLPENR